MRRLLNWLYQNLCCTRCGAFVCAWRVECFTCQKEQLDRSFLMRFAPSGTRVMLLRALPEFGLIAGDMGTVVDVGDDDPFVLPDYRRGVEFDVAPGVIIILVRAGYILELCDVIDVPEEMY